MIGQLDWEKIHLIRLLNISGFAKNVKFSMDIFNFKYCYHCNRWRIRTPSSLQFAFNPRSKCFKEEFLLKFASSAVSRLPLDTYDVYGPKYVVKV